MSSVTRREFLEKTRAVLAALGLTAVAGPIAGFFYPADTSEEPSEPVRVGPEGELPPEGTTVKFGRYPALVIPTSQGAKAYSAVCTHFACLVKYDPSLGQIVCPCHEGYFDPLDGHVISGPPPKALPELAVTIENGDIYVGGAA